MVKRVKDVEVVQFAEATVTRKVKVAVPAVLSGELMVSVAQEVAKNKLGAWKIDTVDDKDVESTVTEID